jgi:hypothetical protein
MKIAQKLKIALDETRMLVLGAQILIGFQFRGVFQDLYSELPASSRYLNGVALLLMVLTLALLILPGTYHRIVEDGNASGRFQVLTDKLAAIALTPVHGQSRNRRRYRWRANIRDGRRDRSRHGSRRACVAVLVRNRDLAEAINRTGGASYDRATEGHHRTNGAAREDRSDGDRGARDPSRLAGPAGIPALHRADASV